MSQRSCAHCRQPLIGRQRKYCAACAPLASLLWNRVRRLEWKACQQPNTPPYWRDGWKNRTDAERRRYAREYMRAYRQGLRRRPARPPHRCAHCGEELAGALASVVVLVSAFIFTACAQPATLRSSTQTAPSNETQPVAAAELELKPVHRQILQATGWLLFVEANIDVLRYYPWSAFATEVGPAWGLASYTEGRRVADIATEGREDRDVVATIVHEAAHLAGLRRIGQMYDQHQAEALTAQFLANYDVLHRATAHTHQALDQSQPMIELRIELIPSSSLEHERDQP